jgi:hypothetical protein
MAVVTTVCSLCFQEFGMPHDIVVTKDGRVFVGDAATDSVLKFSSDSKSTLTKVFQIIQDVSLRKFN